MEVSKSVAGRISALREEMKKRGLDVYIVPTSDYHESEYVGEYFKARKFLTGFTGSAGTAVVTLEEAGLWTDGRYFIQAEAQIAGSGVTLYKSGEEGVPTVEEFVEKKLKEHGGLGFDGRVMNTAQAEKFEKIAAKKQAVFSVTEDLAGMIWEERPEFPVHPIWALAEEYAGESTVSKLARVREKMAKENADAHILTSLYDIAWLLNIRGGDIDCVPVVLSFLVITKEECLLYISEKALTVNTREYLQSQQVSLRPYDSVYEELGMLKAKHILLCKQLTNYRIIKSLPSGAAVIDKENPTEFMKAIKNPLEIENTRKAHIKDGVAVTKFLYWLKTNIGKIRITETSASDYLEKLRREQENFLDLSFATISAYGANAAMMHYTATPQTDTELKAKGFLLVDSGGHYLEGTTDITRTIALGELSDEEKLHFTAVCRANLNLAAAKFLYGCRGLNLDILARGPLWELGIDYKCGTGHGVGHILNVHEGPNGFRWKLVAERNDSGVLEEGMVTTDEPGVYIEGKYGIRTENELLCRKAEKNEYGQFMRFENITYAPIDLDAILPEEMSRSEKQRLNEYHKMVYDTISPYLTEEERAWLKENTRAI